MLSLFDRLIKGRSYQVGRQLVFDLMREDVPPLGDVRSADRWRVISLSSEDQFEFGDSIEVIHLNQEVRLRGFV